MDRVHTRPWNNARPHLATYAIPHEDTLSSMAFCLSSRNELDNAKLSRNDSLSNVLANKACDMSCQIASFQEGCLAALSFHNVKI